MRMFGARLVRLLVELSAVILTASCIVFFWLFPGFQPGNLREAYNVLFVLVFIYFIIQLFYVAFADIGAQGKLVLDVLVSLLPFLACGIALLEYAHGSLVLSNFQFDVAWYVMAVSLADIAANTAIRARLQQLIAIKGHSASH